MIANYGEWGGGNPFAILAVFAVVVLVCAIASAYSQSKGQK